MKQKTYQFENFVLDQKNRQLFWGDQRIALTSKNFEILSLLVENNLRIVEKREIFEAVWGNNFVEENNLPVRIFHLRGLFKKYGYVKEFIKTVSGRGYIFIIEAQELLGSQSETSSNRFLQKLTDNSEADNFYFKGKYIIDTLSTRTKLEDDLSQAEVFFNAAIRSNPGYTEAYVGKANCEFYLYNFGYLSKKESHTRCKILLKQARSANPNSSEVLLLEGLMNLVFELNISQANKLLFKAIELNPSNSEAYFYLGTSHIILNDPKTAHEYFLKACEILPANIRFRNAVIRVHYYSQDFNRAISVAKDILEMDGRSYAALFFLCLSYARLGIYGEAMRYCDELFKTVDNYEIRLLRAYILVLQKQPEEADRLIGEILPDEKRLGNCLIYIILIYTAQNKLNEAFGLLLAYYEKAHFDILLVKTEPGLENLRQDERFQTVLEKLFHNSAG